MTQPTLAAVNTKADRNEHIALAMEGAWNVYCLETIACVDADPADARRRYWETMDRINRAEKKFASEGMFK